jgi:hypothetical protein
MKTVSFSGQISYNVLQTFPYEFPHGKRFAFFSQQVSSTITQTVVALFPEHFLL